MSNDPSIGGLNPGSSCLHVEVFLGKTLNPTLPPDVCECMEVRTPPHPPMYEWSIVECFEYTQCIEKHYKKSLHKLLHKMLALLVIGSLRSQ